MVSAFSCLYGHVGDRIHLRQSITNMKMLKYFKTYLSQFLCKFYYGVGQLCMLSSVFIICFMAADRYFQIKSAPRVRKRSTQFYQIGSLICWMLSIALTFPGLVLKKLFEFLTLRGYLVVSTVVLNLKFKS